MRMIFPLCIALLLIGCGPERAAPPDEPERMAEDVPDGVRLHRFNGRDPVFANGVLTFTVEEGDCSTVLYGDGRGESDCFNGNLRSVVYAPERAYLGDRVLYEMEVFVPQELSYGGGPNRRSLLEIGEWNRINTIKNHVYTLHLDSRRGIAFNDTPCVPPSGFGAWQKIEIDVLWADDDRGAIRVTCAGSVVFEHAGNTAVPSDCGIARTYQCVPELQDTSQPVQFIAGLLFRGYGERSRQEGLRKAGRVAPEGGFTIRMRNLRVTQI